MFSSSGAMFMRPAVDRRLLRFRLSGILNSAATATLLAIMLANAGPLHAATINFFVSTSSTSNANISSCGILCNVSNLGMATYNTNTGATTQTLGTGTASGTANVLGLTSSFDQTGAFNGTTGAAASSSAAGDLSSGTVRALDTGVTLGGEGSSVVELFDTLIFTVHGPGVNGSTITNIGISDNLNGIDPDTGFTNGINFALVVGEGAQGSADAAFSYSTPGPSTVSQLGWVSANVSSSTLSNFAFQGVFSGQGATFTDTVDLKLSVACSNETCDYSHTGTLSLNLPSNVTFTSASGVFLTQPVSEAPEPGSWAMMAGGLVVLLGMTIKRRHPRSAHGERTPNRNVVL
jgi:hypothetical protein